MTMRAPILIHCAFPTSFTDLCLSVLLQGDDIKWKLPQQSALAPRGNTWVLDTDAKVTPMRFAMLSRSFEQRAYRLLADFGVSVNEASLVAQCFATRMLGQALESPKILPHVDNYQVKGHRPVMPLYTLVFYPRYRSAAAASFSFMKAWS